MGKIIDITDKLNFEGNPRLKINDMELEVNADAPTMLKVMALMDGDGIGPSQVLALYDLMFPEESRNAIDALKLDFSDLLIVVQEAVALISGEADSQRG